VISPYVRRRRLATELIRLREEHDCSADKLAKMIGVARQRISRVENGHVRPDLDEIMRVLDVLNVGEKRWTQIMTIAREAQERGWWEKFADEMGPRQALYANLEAGARGIQEYQMTLLPGLLQVPDFTAARTRTDKADWSAQFDPARALEARAGRQRVLERPGGPTYDVIIDEVAVRRLAAPPDVVANQLRHLVNVGNKQKKITIRVLPLAAQIAGYAVPKSAFFIYRYPDPRDPVVIAVDTVTSDLVLTDAITVNHYLALYERLQDAALDPLQSLSFLATVAQELFDETGISP
jgi:transcriptional regulator with XRE-family HTH domain